ncbi:MAG: YDG domain-containing protein, partial [Clostridiales bacterium]|nr:YDG domain-containing protein [Clostridiales bacterium]
TGTFTLNGGTISYNNASSSGGGVYNEIYNVSTGTFTMNGGTISYNSANYGGGVYNRATFTMNGSTSIIKGNQATVTGGGVYNGTKGTFDMKAGTVSGNTAEYVGGVYVGIATFTMEGGTISDNTATYCGCIWVQGTFTMEGGTISNNTAVYYCGGVYVEGDFSISGSPVITGNTVGEETAKETANVYLPSGIYITLGSDLTSGADIGVTTAQNLQLGETVQITTETGENRYYASAISYISSDNTKYTVQINSTEGYLKLRNTHIPGEVAITGDAVYGQTLTAAVTGGPGSGTLSWQWLRGTEEISGATSSTYTLTADDVGKTITVEVTHSDYTGNLSATSDTVQQATLTASISIGADGTTTKTYDGTTNVTSAQGLSITLDGIVGTDDVMASAQSYAYNSADIAEANTITASGITLSGTDAGNYTLGDNVTATISGSITAKTLTKNDFTVDTEEKTYTAAAITPSVASANAIVTVDDYTVTYTNNISVGSAGITITGKGNCTGELSYTFSIGKADLDVTWPSGLTGKQGEALSTVTLADGFTWADGTQILQYGSHTYSMIYTPEDTANYHILTADIVVYGSDVTAPDVTISAGGNFWNTFSGSITTELYFNATQTVTITAEDMESGLSGTWYYLSETELTKEEVQALTDSDWKTCDGSGFEIAPANTYIIYAKATDMAGNTTYVSSDWLTLDSAVPTFTGLTEGGGYCTSVSFTVSDDCAVTVTVDGVTAIPDGSGSYTIAADNQEHIVVATDAAGNSRTATVTVNNGHTWEYSTDGTAITEKCSICSTAASVMVSAPSGGQTYDGNSHNAVLSYNGTLSGGNDLAVSYTWSATENGTKTAVTDTTAAGYYTATVSLGGQSASVDYQVSPKSVSDTCTISLEYTETTYDGSEKEPSVMVKDEETVLDPGEYTVTYTDNTDVGTACVTVTSVEGGNYSFSKSVSFTVNDAKLTDVAVSQTGALTYNGTAQTAGVHATATTVDGSTVTFTYSTKEDGTFSSEVPSFTDAGTYMVYYRAAAANHDTVGGSFTVDIGAKALGSDDFEVTQADGDAIVTLDTDSIVTIHYTGSAITPSVTVASGSLVTATDYEVSYSDNTAVGTAKVTVTGKGNFTGTVEYQFQIIDQETPTGSITIGGNTWNTFWNTATFGLFFNETQTVTVSANDSDGIAKTEYYLSDVVAESTDDLADVIWTAFTESFHIEPENSYVVYVRLTDHSGNSTIINSDGIVLETTAPEITGLTDQGIYCADVTFTVTDENLDYVLVDGEKVTGEAVEATDGGSADGTSTAYRYTITADGDSHTIQSFDKAGNASAVYEVTVNNGHTLTHHEKVEPTATESGTVEYWHCEACGKNFADSEGKEEITDLMLPATGDTSSGNLPSGRWKHGLTLDADGVFRYYQNNVFAKDYVGVVPYDGSLFFIKNGLVDVDANGLCLYEDVWYFVSLGQVQLQYTGLALYDGAWFYVTDGILDTTKNGFVPYDGERFLVAAGKLLLDYNGLWLNASSIGGDDCWYFLAVGMVQNVSGVVMYDDAWFVIADGKLDTDYNGSVIYDGAKFTVVNGQLQL